MQFKGTKFNQSNNVSGGEDFFKWIKKLAVLKESSIIMEEYLTRRRLFFWKDMISDVMISIRKLKVICL